MAKDIKFSSDARSDAVVRGVDVLADTVKVTLALKDAMWESGSLVFTFDHKWWGDSSQKKSIKDHLKIWVPDWCQKWLNQWCRRWRYNDRNGLDQAIVQKGSKRYRRCNPIGSIRRGFYDSCCNSSRSFENNAIPVSSKEAIAQVAAVPSRSEKSVSTSLKPWKSWLVDGVITIEESRGMETTEAWRYAILTGYLSQYMVTDNEKWWQTLKIHTFDHSTRRFQISKKSCHCGFIFSNRPLLIIADDVDGEASSPTLVRTRSAWYLVVAVKAIQDLRRRKAMQKTLPWLVVQRH